MKLVGGGSAIFGELVRSATWPGRFDWPRDSLPCCPVERGGRTAPLAWTGAGSLEGGAASC